MRSPLFLLTYFGAAFAMVAVAQADTATVPYYNPTNTASTTGTTVGKELYRTIGCPGRALLDPVCNEDAPVPVVAPAVAAIVPVPQEAPALAPIAPVAVPEPIALIQPTPPVLPAEPIVVAKSQPIAPAENTKPEECYSKFIKSATDSFRDAANNWIKAKDIAYGKAM